LSSTHPASVEGGGLMGERAVQSMVHKTVVRETILVGQPLFNGSWPVRKIKIQKSDKNLKI
jgi:hypothetical protein